MQGPSYQASYLQQEVRLQLGHSACASQLLYIGALSTNVSLYKSRIFAAFAARKQCWPVATYRVNEDERVRCGGHRLDVRQSVGPAHADD